MKIEKIEINYKLPEKVEQQTAKNESTAAVVDS